MTPHALLLDNRIVIPLAHADARGRVYELPQQRSLYVSRRVLNADEIIAWAKARGFKTCLPPEDMHVTVCFSKAPMVWNRAGDHHDKITANHGTRSLELLGSDGAVVIKFESALLQDRHQQFRDAGASWDHESYNPHITLSYDPPDPLPLEPYHGPIELGPEIFAEVVSKWASDLRELVQGHVRAFAFNPDQPRDEDGKWTAGAYRPGGRHADRKKRIDKAQPGKFSDIAAGFSEKAIKDKFGAKHDPDDYDDRPDDDADKIIQAIDDHSGSTKLSAKNLKYMDMVYKDMGVELKQDTVLYRGIDLPRPVIKEIMSAAHSGKSVLIKQYENRYVPTSTSRSYAEGFGGALLEVVAPKGTRVLPVGKMNGYGEKEITLDRGAHFRVVSYRRNVVRVELVNSYHQQRGGSSHYSEAEMGQQRSRFEHFAGDIASIEIDDAVVFEGGPETSYAQAAPTYAQELRDAFDEMEARAVKALRTVLVHARGRLIARVLRGSLEPRGIRLAGLKDFRMAVRDLLERASTRGGKDARKEVREGKRAVKEYHTPGGHGHDQQSHAGDGGGSGGRDLTAQEWDQWHLESPHIIAAQNGTLKPGTGITGFEITEKNIPELKAIGDAIQAEAEAHYLPGLHSVYRGEIYQNMEEVAARYGKRGTVVEMKSLTSTSISVDDATTYAKGKMIGGQQTLGEIKEIYGPNAVRVLVSFQQKGGIQGTLTKDNGKPTWELVLPKGVTFKSGGFKKIDEHTAVVGLWQNKPPKGAAMSVPAGAPRSFGSEESMLGAMRDKVYSMQYAFNPDQPRDDDGKWTDGGTVREHEFGHAGQKVRVQSEDEIYALESYFEDSSVNDALRRGGGKVWDSYDQETVTHLDKIIARSTLENEAVLYRGFRDSAGGLLEKLRQGERVVDHGFQSWTASLGTARDFGEEGFVVKATFRAGTRALSAGGDQKEVILPRGRSIVYRGVDSKGIHQAEVN